MDPPYYECDYDKETMEHYLLEYRNYKEPRKKLREGKNESRNSAWRSSGDKAHNGIHKSNREIKQLESKAYIDSKAGYGGRASMDGCK
jgi:hypothetical protein